MNRISAETVVKTALAVDEKIAKGEPLIVFDLETTGLRQSDRILSLSALKVTKNNGLYKVLGKLDLMFNPEMEIPKEATAVNGITNAMVAKCKTEKEHFATVTNFFGDSPIVAGYNSVSFDARFMQAMYKRNNQTFAPAIHLDVMKMAREMYELKNYKLENVAHELGVDRGISFHNSMDDVYATFRCMCMILLDYKTKQSKKYEHVTIQACRYWKGPNHILERVYVTTLPRGNTYYDIYRKEWKTTLTDANLHDIRSDTLYFMRAENEAEMVRMLKTRAAEKQAQEAAAAI